MEASMQRILSMVNASPNSSSSVENPSPSSRSNPSLQQNGALPGSVQLDVSTCPCCGQLWRPFPGFSFIDGDVLFNGRRANLSRLEFMTFALLWRRQGLIVSREAAHEHLYQLRNEEVDPKIFDVYLSRIRKKLKVIGAPNLIQKIWSIGWKLHRIPQEVGHCGPGRPPKHS
jgi:hypothetical protein